MENSVPTESHSGNIKSRLTLPAFFMFSLSSLFVFYDFFLQVVPAVLAGPIMADFKVTSTVMGTISAAYYVTCFLLIDILTSKGVTGLVAERVLEDCNIVVNKNRIQGDQKSPLITSGIRLGTNALALRGLGTNEMVRCVNLIDSILSATKMIDDRTYALDETVKTDSLNQVADLCKKFPLPNFRKE